MTFGLASGQNMFSGWTRSPRNPMLSLGSGSEFDSQNIMSPSVVKDGGKYFLFYSGGPLGPANGGDFVRYQLGLATSHDGERWKKRGAPLLALGDRDDFHVTPTLVRSANGDLYKRGGEWHMLYCANRADDVDYATSKDGLTWTKDLRSPIFRKAYAPNVLHADGEFRMYYIFKPSPDSGKARPWEVHLATGPDLFSLRPHAANPILTITQGWEKNALFYPYVLREGYTWIMLYAAYWNHQTPGDSRAKTAIGLATSADGIHWKKSEGNPILTPDANSAFESVYVSSQSLIRDGDHYKLYYAARIDAVHKYYSICMARHSGRLARAESPREKRW